MTYHFSISVDENTRITYNKAPYIWPYIAFSISMKGLGLF